MAYVSAKASSQICVLLPRHFSTLLAFAWNPAGVGHAGRETMTMK